MEIEKIVQIVKNILDEEMNKNNLIPIEASGKHVHLSKEHIEELFGKDYEMKIKKELSQPGQYLYEERVRVIGPKGIIENVAVLGPARDNTQIEISLTDSKILGINAPIRESGTLKNSSVAYISNKNKMVKVENGAIVAKRHIHMNKEDAKKFNLKDKDIVKVKVLSKRPIIFEDVLVRVSESFKLSMHIDFDEANACAYEDNVNGEIIK